MSIIGDHLTDDCMRGMHDEPERPLDAYEEAAEAAARERWCTDDLVIDDVLTKKDFSAGDDGCWVRAWVWVPDDVIEAIE